MSLQNKGLRINPLNQVMTAWKFEPLRLKVVQLKLSSTNGAFRLAEPTASFRPASDPALRPGGSKKLAVLCME
ncbi:hypothetical protein AML91_01505 [Paenibacillus jilunlii]|uniref:Uncharacterized protein n=1 Tax=Paenibacillus jilunlii TaxID=682956 RepID=A0ABR5T0X6_9BACL|nr:hypothetical protein AML91_01505 [Paenibacillus jilunlii]